MSALEQIEKAVLALPVKQRGLLAETLLDSLPPVGEAWPEEVELAEVERREHEVESGAVQPIPEAEFWRRVEVRRRQ